MPSINTTNGALPLDQLGRTLDHEHVLVGFPSWYLDNLVPDEVRIRNLKQLVDAGHRDRIMVSQDTVNCWLRSPPGMTASDAAAMAPNWS
jgi:predicted metal-dependent phosphotriesterase family hydrolase